MHLWTTRGYGGAVAKRDEAGTYEAATEEILNTCEQEYLNSELPFLPLSKHALSVAPRSTGKGDRSMNSSLPMAKEGDLAARLKAIFNLCQLTL